MDKSELNIILEMCKKRINKGESYDDIKNKHTTKVFLQLEDELRIFENNYNSKSRKFWIIKASMKTWENDGSDEFHNLDKEFFEKIENKKGEPTNNIKDIVFMYNHKRISEEYPEGIYLVGEILSRIDNSNHIKIEILKDLRDEPFYYKDMFSSMYQDLNTMAIRGRAPTKAIIRDEDKPQILFDMIMNDEPLAEEIDGEAYEFIEGAVKKITVNAYERSRQARLECINNYGYKCAVCKFDFEAHYGKIGKNFIHVHHLEEMSNKGKSYKVNPIEDLIPVCPNCHVMLHKKKPAYTIDELKSIIAK